MDQDKINRWAEETFGAVGSNVSIAARANQEMAELLRCLTADDNHEKAAEEVADVVIVLLRLLGKLNTTLETEVEKKMCINYKRAWIRDGDGHGRHI